MIIPSLIVETPVVVLSARILKSDCDPIPSTSILDATVNRLRFFFLTVSCLTVIHCFSLDGGCAQDRVQVPEERIVRPTLNGVEFSQDGSKLLTVGNAIRVVDVDSGRVTKSWPLKPEVFVSRAEFIPGKEPRYVAGTLDGMIYVWSDSWDKPELTFEKQNGNLNDLSLSPDGSHLATSYTTYDQGKAKTSMVVLWNLKTGDALHKSTFDKHAINSVRFAPNGQSVAYSVDDPSDGDSRLEIRNVMNWKLEEVIEFRPGFASRIVWSNDGQSIAIAGGECIPTGPRGCQPNGRLWLAKRHTKEPAKLIDRNPLGYYGGVEGGESEDQFIVTTSQAKQIVNNAGQVVGRMISEVQIRDFNTGEITSRIHPEETRLLLDIACWRAGNLIALCDLSSKIRLFDYKTEELVDTIVIKVE